MLDFVPNHTGLDHPWVEEHPEYYVAGGRARPGPRPQNYRWVRRSGGDLLLAYGRDPYFPGWPDTFQLNYANPATREAMVGELLKIAGQCDGVRCDMAMLVLPDVFERTWGIQRQPFWPKATRAVRERYPGSASWPRSTGTSSGPCSSRGSTTPTTRGSTTACAGGHARPVREHLRAGLDYQGRLARFLENHDEPRAAATFPPDVHEAAAVITFLSPGLRFFHQGQLEGPAKRISPHLVRGPDEPVDPAWASSTTGCSACCAGRRFGDGQWQLLECSPAWDGNWTHDCFVVFAWQGAGEQRLVVAVNFAPNQSQCHVRRPSPAWPVAGGGCGTC